MSKGAVVSGLAVVLAGLVLVILLRHRCRLDEERALEDLVRFGLETRAFAFNLNDGGYVSPARLVQASDDQPSVRLLPARFLLDERGGYRFVFEGHDSAPDPDDPWLVSPAFRSFTYQATPVRWSCSRRSFLLSTETMAIHAREDGALPTTGDPMVERLDGARISPR